MPMKLREEIVRIAAPIASVACTMIGPMAFGTMWRMMMRASLVPQAFAASTNS